MAPMVMPIDDQLTRRRPTSQCVGIEVEVERRKELGGEYQPGGYAVRGTSSLRRTLSGGYFRRYLRHEPILNVVHDTVQC